jgi:hypothetical protein
MSIESTHGEPSTSASIFLRDRFRLNQPIAVSEKHLISDETGQPLLVVKCPSRLGRLIAAVLLACLTLMLLLFVGIVGLAELRIFDVIPMVMATLVAGAAALTVFVAVLGRQTLSFCRQGDPGPPLLVLRPEPGLTGTYSLLDGEGTPLASLRTNYFLHAQRVRWHAYGPDHSLLAMVQEDSVLPGFIRRPMRGGVILLLYVVLFGAILLAGQGYLRIPLVVLAAFLPLWLAAYRWLLPNCVFFKPDLQTVLGTLNRRTTEKEGNRLDLQQDCDHYLDRRIALALAVLLDQK